MKNLQEILSEYESKRGSFAKPELVNFKDSPFQWDYVEGRKLSERVLERMVWHSRTPLEECMGASLVYEAAARGWVPLDRRLLKTHSMVRGWVEAIPKTVPIVIIEIARRLPKNQGNYVFDFLMSRFDLSRPAAVECDSLAWHWGRTIEKDRLKDEFAKSQGWTMFRFMANRILTTPGECAKEVIDYVCGERL